MAGASSKGRFVWHELMTTDPAAAIEFYSKVVGWKTAPYDGGGKPYTMWVAGEQPMGGVMDLPAEAKALGVPPHWMGYIGVADIAATVARAQELGGRVAVPAFPIPTVGTVAVIADPQGAFVSLLQPEAGDMPDAPPTAGHISWCELMTTDAAAAIAFYADLFGWEKHSEMDMGPAGTYHLLARDGTMFAGAYELQPGQGGQAAWLYYALVESADAAADRTKAAGGQVMHGPMEIPGGDRIAICTDPQGAWFAVHSTASG